MPNIGRGAVDCSPSQQSAAYHDVNISKAREAKDKQQVRMGVVRKDVTGCAGSDLQLILNFLGSNDCCHQAQDTKRLMEFFPYYSKCYVRPIQDNGKATTELRVAILTLQNTRSSDYDGRKQTARALKQNCWKYQRNSLCTDSKTVTCRFQKASVGA